MSIIRLDHRPSRRKLAVFGVTWLVFFGIVGWIVLKQTNAWPIAGAIWAVAVAVPGVGLFVPQLLQWVYVGMRYAGRPVAVVVSVMLLAGIFYLVISPIGWLTRRFHYDPIGRRFRREAETYWVPRRQDDDVARYFRQF